MASFCPQQAVSIEHSMAETLNAQIFISPSPRKPSYQVKSTVVMAKQAKVFCCRASMADLIENEEKKQN
ncbi:hypothetical protein AMTR_s00147p00104600 [Amborella trichopoda]|uniref:Uncharacterized protein n=1 Tax=Amborella trichopoda TaxID=13333 RepID=W1P9N0_AMBTC|nr:hypothetical protein AMTR_s00147p00104600 [Amborella trichopoda]